MLTQLISGKRMVFTIEEVTASATISGLTNRREREEMIDKFRGLGLLDIEKV